jgi:hypothetical protein
MTKKICAQSISIASSHVVMLSQPDAVANLILEAAG